MIIRNRTEKLVRHSAVSGLQSLRDAKICEPAQCVYAVYRFASHMNHFLPVQKLVTKVRDGSKVKKVYDNPKTLYQRVLDAP